MMFIWLFWRTFTFLFVPDTLELRSACTQNFGFSRICNSTVIAAALHKFFMVFSCVGECLRRMKMKNKKYVAIGF